MTNPTGTRQGRSAPPAEGGVDPRAFRDVLAGFASGVVLVSGMADEGPVGFTCQAFTSLSVDPPLVAFCPSSTSVSWGRIRPAGAFCVNVLADHQQELSAVFAQRRDDKFDHVTWRHGATGAPVIDGAVAHIDCEIEEIHAGGDHEIVVGRVVDLARDRDRTPLLYFGGRYGTLIGGR
ncbi:flavin reductase family protein [Actinomadura sp. 9N407]|uniref:flavin reductase family protein n=1 Tax=Actinomadura sp. 9N407 TaxID=3375154 RepID=UPI00378D98D8